jgi:signal transduction histidine kinase
MQRAFRSVHESYGIKHPGELARIYRAWEKRRCDAGVTIEAVRSSAFKHLSVNVPQLLEDLRFRLIFERPRPQERMLCQRFLIKTMRQISIALGPRNDLLDPLREWVLAIPNVEPPVPFNLRLVLPSRNSEWITLLYRLSRAPYVKCSDKLGDARTYKCYELAYDEMTSRYSTLSSFPVIFNLLPPALIDSGKLDMLSRSQVQTMLMRNIEDATKVKAILREQNEKLDAAHRELEIAHAGLERRVAERTAELQAANEQLRNAKDHAEMADRTKSEFLTNMSHELRTPLNAIMGFSEVIKEAMFGPLDQRYRDYAHDIHNSGAHLLAVINDILDLSKLESGQLELFEELHPVEDLLKSCLEMIDLRARNGNVALNLEIENDLPLLNVDALRFRQIVINLLSNAVKFTSAGGRVDVTARTVADGDLVIQVSDTGIGMKPADIARAMEPFRQISNPLNRRHEGTGLGLSLVKRLVELQGGIFDLASTPGEGTRASVRFPASRLIPPPAARAAG